MNQRRADLLSVLQESNQRFRTDSTVLLEDAGSDVSEFIRCGRLLLGVDLGYSKDLLLRADADKVRSATGVNIGKAKMLTNALLITYFLSIPVIVILGIVVGGWFGLLSIPIIIFVFLFGSSLALRGKYVSGSVLAVAGFAYSVFSVAHNQMMLGAFAFAISAFAFSQLLLYIVPKRCVRRYCLASTDFLELAIQSDAAVLEKSE